MNKKMVEKLAVGIPGFDFIADGGLPNGRTTLVAGTSGSGKTVFGMQFLFCGVHRHDQPGVLVTFEERPEDLVRNVRSLGWDLDEMIEAGKLAIVDVSPEPGEEIVETGSFDFSALLARIESAARRIGAERVVLDAIGGVFPQFSDANVVRRELHRVVSGLREMGVTTLLTVERSKEYGEVSRFGIEEFVADNVIVMRNSLEKEKRRRTIEILKFRGTTHHKGEYPFTIEPRAGVSVLPLSAIDLTQHSSNVRISSGNTALDKMCNGGFFRDSVVLVSGGTGTGKTLMATEFINGALANGERALLMAFEESREQLFRNAESWGVDYTGAEERGLLRLVCRYPEAMGLEDHLLNIKREIEEFRPTRVVVDSLSALERVSTDRAFREFIVGLTSHIKAQQIAGVVTNTTSVLGATGSSVTESHISSITDAIVLLRYVELWGEMRRGVTVLKMRGSWHDKAIREYTINAEGINIGEPFKSINGILGGHPVYSFDGERENLDNMFAGIPES